MTDVYQPLEDEVKTKERLGCCGCLEKWFIWIVNMALFLVGLVQIAAGAYALKSDTVDWTGTTLPKAVIILGAFVMVIAFLGCCGAARENKCMLWIYALLLFFLILGQTACFSVMAVSGNYTEKFLQDAWEHLEPETITKIQDTFECCSFNGDYNVNPDAGKEDHAAWETCKNQYSETCYNKVHDEVKDNIKIVLISA